MKKQFLTNFLLLLLINLLIKPVYVLLIETTVQNKLGTETFGLYFFHLNFVYLFQFMGDFGLQTWNNQHISKNRLVVASYILPVFAVKIGLTLIWMTTVVVFGTLSSALDLSLLLWIGLNLILSSWFLLIRTFLSGLGFYKLDSWLSSLDKMLMVLFIGFLLWLTHEGRAFTLQDFIQGQTYSLVIANLVALILLLVKVQWKGMVWNFAAVPKVLIQCIPYAFVLLLMMTYSKVDGFLLGYLLTDQGLQAGIYAASYRIFDAANMFLYLIPALILPMFSYMLSKGEAVDKLYDLVFRWLFVILGPILLLTLVFSKEVLSLLYEAHVDEKVTTLRLLMASSVFVSFAYIFGALSMAGDKITKLIPVFLTGLMINLLGNILLIPAMGAKGAALVALFTQVCVFTGQYLVVRKEMSFRWNGKIIANGLVFWFILLLTGFVTTSLFHAEVLWSIIFSLIISLPLAFGLKLVDRSDIDLLLSRKNDSI